MRKFFGLLWRGIIIAFSIISFTLAYTQEEIDAYKRAYKNRLTTQPTIDEANLNWKLTRQELSKMLTNYIENIAWVEKNWRPCTFTDESKTTNDLKPYTRKICSYWIMWTDWEDFRPTSKVTRAELWTTISRMLWGTKHNVSWKDFYIYHLNALKNNGIMNNLDNPTTTLARRWDTFIMFKRIYEKFGSKIDLNSWSTYTFSFSTEDADWGDDDYITLSLDSDKEKIIYTWKDWTEYSYWQDFLKELKKLADQKWETDLSNYLKLEINHQENAIDMASILDWDESSEELEKLIWIKLDDIRDMNFQALSKQEKTKYYEKIKNWINTLLDNCKKADKDFVVWLWNISENIKNDKFWLKDKYKITKDYINASEENLKVVFDALFMLIESDINSEDIDDDEMLAAVFWIMWVAMAQEIVDTEYKSYNEQWAMNTINVLEGKSDKVNINSTSLNSLVNTWESYKKSEWRARDVARKNDLAQIQTAIITSQQDRWMWPWVNQYNLTNWVTTWATKWMRISEISNNLYKAWMSSIPWDPNILNLVYWLWEKYNTKDNARKNWAEWDYLYVVSTRNWVSNGGFTLMAKTETEWWSNWVVCENGQGLDKWYITNTTDLREVKLCSTLTKWNTCSASACTYTDEGELRYILLY